ncbi:MAG: Crp/Fnr family transcriptional regulator [Bryobacteraceae bacterium]|jgi:CRP/FNR family transcriptional regulator
MPEGPVPPRQILKATPLFAALDESELNSLAARCRIQAYSSGQILFSEGDPSKGLYIVVSGRVRIFKTSLNGREQVLAIEGPGASVAELPVFDGGSYPASASALERTEALFVSRADLRAICLEHPEVSLKMLQVVGARLRRLVDIIEELSFTTVRHRLISWLLRQASAEGRRTGRGVVFSLNASHQELAARIGTVRELVSRNLARLQAQSLIEMNGREITILDRESLEADLASLA